MQQQKTRERARFRQKARPQRTAVFESEKFFKETFFFRFQF
jgi:hypothetical protein